MNAPNELEDQGLRQEARPVAYAVQAGHTRTEAAHRQQRVPGIRLAGYCLAKAAASARLSHRPGLPGRTGAIEQWSFDGWCCKLGETVFGPVSRAQLRQLVAAGQLRRADRIWEVWRRGAEMLMVASLGKVVCDVPNFAAR
jgi:hypothetical protein